jgi:outer membrane receptor protein involved in Fe transport
VLERHGSDDPLIPAFNTPEHKYNVGFSIRNWKNVGFNINYKWVQGFNYEGSPQFTGYIPDYDLIDVQANYRFEERLTFKLGASNVLNNKHYEVYGGPLVGRLIYFSILLELKDVFKN